ncbi:MAG: hypothetical protein K6B40_04865 [Firmicutes bacterium]|nr:hypothetical protein [Bacillota bacterium]
MKSKKTLAVLLALAVMLGAVASVSGCAQAPDSEPVEDTQTSDGAPIEDTQTPDSEPVDGEDDMEFTVLFQKGVWSASIDGEVDTYFIFTDENNGRTEKADGTGGVPFTCEQNGLNAVFHFGSADDVTPAAFSTGDNTGTFEYADKTVVYTFEFVPEADPETFAVPAE